MGSSDPSLPLFLTAAHTVVERQRARSWAFGRTRFHWACVGRNRGGFFTQPVRGRNTARQIRARSRVVSDRPIAPPRACR